MHTRKNLLIVVGEWWEAQSAAQSAARRTESSNVTPNYKPGRLSRLVKWLLPNGGTLLLIALLIATQSVWARNLQAPAAPGPSATTVNYQGRLADSGGTPINGSRAMTFAIYDAATSGNLIWGPETHAAIPVSSGLFSVGLGSQTSGGIPTTTWNGDRYLEIMVGGETLSPRELIRSVPIAEMALTVPDGAIGTSQIASSVITTTKIADGAVTSAKLGLQSDCRRIVSPSPISVTSTAAWGNSVEIPYTSLTVTLDRPSRVFYMAQGVVMYDYLNGENVILLAVNGSDTYHYLSKGDSIDTFVITDYLDLPPGTHNLTLRYTAEIAGATMHMQGWVGRSSICYVVIDQ